MKISKIFAGMSALALAASMAICVSANDLPPTNEKSVNGKQTWEAVYGWENCIPAQKFSGGDVTVTVKFEWTEKGLEKGMTSFKPMFANGSVALGEAQLETGETYITGVPVQGTDVVESEESLTGYANADGSDAFYGITADEGNAGWIQFWRNLDDDEGINECTFTITAAAIAQMKDFSSYFGDGAAYVNEETGDTLDWDGFNIQTGNNGITITSIEFSEDLSVEPNGYVEQEGGEESTPDESTPEESTPDESTPDESTPEDSTAAPTDGGNNNNNN
ncbi:MAG: hypothetical protein IKN17_11895, partial [Ruminococcus sp.]|nr:hypothetical protein [Ruminococcus sp.]